MIHSTTSIISSIVKIRAEDTSKSPQFTEVLCVWRNVQTCPIQLLIRILLTAERFLQCKQKNVKQIMQQVRPSITPVATLVRTINNTQQRSEGGFYSKQGCVLRAPYAAERKPEGGERHCTGRVSESKNSCITSKRPSKTDAGRPLFSHRMRLQLRAKD